MLPIHKDVLEAYFSELGGQRVSAEWPSAKKSSVEYDGTVTEGAESDPCERVVVARWSIDLTGRIWIKLLRQRPSLKEG